jgi:hypothetical protein
MIEVMSVVCSLAICVLAPIEVNRIRAGWVNQKFEGDRRGFVAAYRRQLVMLMWLGLGFGALSLGLSLVEADAGQRLFKVAAGSVWFAVAATSRVSQGRLPVEA